MKLHPVGEHAYHIACKVPLSEARIPAERQTSHLDCDAPIAPADASHPSFLPEALLDLEPIVVIVQLRRVAIAVEELLEAVSKSASYLESEYARPGNLTWPPALQCSSSDAQTQGTSPTLERA